MKQIYPTKLKAGDEIRVISPSQSMSLISGNARIVAQKRFEELGLKLTFGANIEESDDFTSSSVAMRVDDMHNAFNDPDVKGIITVIGGFNSNQLLREIDWDIIKNNPKVFCGFSDITALNNAILTKTGLVTYSGLHYSSFGMENYFDYSLDYFKKCLMTDGEMLIEPSKEWTDDQWFLDQEKRAPIANDGWLIINEGQAQGRIIGGNMCTLNLLQGTEYMPDLTDSVLFMEDDEESHPEHFDRNLISLIQQPGFSGVKAIVIGRFQNASNMTNDLLIKIIKSKKELANTPVIANIDFGHTSPIVTFPVGGEVKLEVKQQNSEIKIVKH
jgi:muramoyltetrapeptide carboxypeptidase